LCRHFALFGTEGPPRGPVNRSQPEAVSFFAQIQFRMQLNAFQEASPSQFYQTFATTRAAVEQLFAPFFFREFHRKHSAARCSRILRGLRGLAGHVPWHKTHPSFFDALGTGAPIVTVPRRFLLACDESVQNGERLRFFFSYSPPLMLKKFPSEKKQKPKKPNPKPKTPQKKKTKNTTKKSPSLPKTLLTTFVDVNGPVGLFGRDPFTKVLAVARGFSLTNFRIAAPLESPPWEALKRDPWRDSIEKPKDPFC